MSDVLALEPRIAGSRSTARAGISGNSTTAKIAGGGSTKHRKISGNSTTGRKVKALEAQRVELGVSIETLAQRAGISERTWRYAVDGETAIRPATLALVEAALGQLAKRAAPAPEDEAHHGASFRLVVTLLATAAGLEAEAVLGADPRRERGPLARCRMHAYAAMVEAGHSMAKVARLAGVTKQAISKSLKDVEDERTAGGELDLRLSRIARIVGGVQ